MKQLPPHSQPVGARAGVGRGAPLSDAEERMQYAEEQLRRVSAERGMKWDETAAGTNARLSLTIFCTRIVHAENSGLRHQHPVLRCRLEG